MLIEFTVGNYRSFKEPVTLSMVAANIKAKNEQLDKNNTFVGTDDITLLTSSAIYGANASGKSNLIKAIKFMRYFVRTSSKESQINEPINIVPFRLETTYEERPSFFEIVFIKDGVPYRYGFEVTNEKIENEWLFYSPRGREAKLFIREGNNISLSRTYKGEKAPISLTRPNALFLSVAAQFNGDTAKLVFDWFYNLGIISGLDDKTYGGYTARKLSEDEDFKNKILNLISACDLGIDDITTEKINAFNAEMFPDDMPQTARNYYLEKFKDEKLVTYKFIHHRDGVDGGSEIIPFGTQDESEGTLKFINFAGPVIDTLTKGTIIFVDEIEARLHTHLTRKLISLFNSPETNPKHAQLIFATHDTNLLSNKFFRRDQIWFIEKDEFGSSHLYSLSELKVRNTDQYETDYLDGRYGGVPVLGEIKNFLIQHN